MELELLDAAPDEENRMDMDPVALLLNGDPTADEVVDRTLKVTVALLLNVAPAVEESVDDTLEIKVVLTILLAVSVTKLGGNEPVTERVAALELESEALPEKMADVVELETLETVGFDSEAIVGDGQSTGHPQAAMYSDLLAMPHTEVACGG